MSLTLHYRCTLPHGLHARPASEIEAFCNSYCAHFQWHNLRNQRHASAKSVLGLLSTDTLNNDICDIYIEGDDAEAAYAALAHFLTHTLSDTPLEPITHDTTQALPRLLQQSQGQHYRGTPVSPGIGLGILMPWQRNVLAFDILTEETQSTRMAHAEHARATLTQMLTTQAAQSSGTQRDVQRAHIAILNDHELIHTLTCAINNSRTFASAVQQVMEHYQTQFANSENPYLRERELDLRDLCYQLLGITYPTLGTSLHLSEPTLVLAQALTPSEFLSLDRSQLKGLLLGLGGHTSHTVILARAFAIPTLVGVPYAELLAAQGMSAWMDSEIGVVSIGQDSHSERYYTLRQQTELARQAAFAHFLTQPGCTADQQPLDIAANIGTALEAEPAFALGAQSIGLFRTEMLFMDRTAPPSEEEQYQTYCSVLQHAGERTVILRSFDIGGDKPVPYMQMAHENNPFLGCRGVRVYRRQEAIFRTQLRAVLRASAHGNLKLMIPMVQEPDEVIWVKACLAEERAQLETEGMALAPDLPVGIMLEVPSVLYMMEAFCSEVAFFSIGSNDLTQYLLAVDRDNPDVAAHYQALHPALWNALDHAVSTAHQHGRWIGLCGELGGLAHALPLLVGLGLDEISMAAPRIAASKAALAKLHTPACRTLLTHAKRANSTAAVLELLSNHTLDNESPLLDAHTVTLDADWCSKEEVIQAMVARLWVCGRTQTPRELEDAIWQREGIYSTGLGYGIAIPHTKSDAINCATVSVARLTHSIEWNALDGEPVQLVIMLTLPSDQKGEQHLRVFSKLARRIMHEEFRHALQQAPSKTALCNILLSELNDTV